MQVEDARIGIGDSGAEGANIDANMARLDSYYISDSS